jgi:hypothetical protein
MHTTTLPLPTQLTQPNNTNIPDPLPSATTIHNFDAPVTFTDAASYAPPPQSDDA